MARLSIFKLLAIAALLVSASEMAYCQLIPAPLEQRITNSELVVEAGIQHSQSYFGADGRIYTSHVLEIQKVMKGSLDANAVEVVLRGGTVDGTTDWISHHLYLAPGNMGVFFLNPHRSMRPVLLSSGLPAYEVYADLQGCIRYKKQPGATVASEPYRVYSDIERDLYPMLGWQGGNAPKLHEESLEGRDAVAMIDSIRPLAVSAGTRSELKIYGSGFLDTRGHVYFKDSDDGGQTFMVADSTDIREWTDTLIRVWVPSVTPLPNILQGTAGTGPVLIRNTVGDSAQSAEILAVEFAVQNGRDQLTGISRYAHLIDQDTYSGLDTSGGYTFRLSASFSASDSAETAFRKALKTWRCATGVNFKIGGDTVLNSALPETVNLILWDDGPMGNLPQNVLARTEARLIECDDDSEAGHFAQEIDLRFSKQQVWNFDTSLIDTTKWDFLSIALHELGHAHLLYHVIDTTDLMYHSLDSGASRRVLAGYALDGGNWLMDSSEVPHGNCPSSLIPLDPGDCSLLSTGEKSDFTHLVSILPNPSSDRFSIFIETVKPGFCSSISVLNASGISIEKENYNLQQINLNHWTLDLGSLANGIYFVRIDCRNFYSAHKIILLR